MQKQFMLENRACKDEALPVQESQRIWVKQRVKSSRDWLAIHSSTSLAGFFWAVCLFVFFPEYPSCLLPGVTPPSKRHREKKNITIKVGHSEQERERERVIKRINVTPHCCRFRFQIKRFIPCRHMMVEKSDRFFIHFQRERERGCSKLELSSALV